MSVYLPPYLAIDAPIPPPGDNIGRLCFSIDAKWIPYLLAVWKTLTLDAVWETEADRATGEASQVLERFMLMGACTEQLLGSDCEDCMGCCLRVQDGHLQSLNCGVWEDIPGGDLTLIAPASVVNPTSTSDLDPGECREYDFVLPGNGVVNLPVSVSEGNTVEVTGASGQWSSGGSFPHLPAWYCWDGHVYILGNCTGATVTDGADPIPTLPKMALIGQCGGSEEFFDATSGPITIPSGISAESFQFQANTGDQAAAFGSIAFHVKVCNSAPSGVTWSSLNGNTLPSPNPTPGGANLIWPIDDSGSGFWYSDISLSPSAHVSIIFNNQTVTGSGAGISAYPPGGGGPTNHPQGFTGDLGPVVRIIYQTNGMTQGSPLVQMAINSIP